MHVGLIYRQSSRGRNHLRSRFLRAQRRHNCRLQQKDHDDNWAQSCPPGVQLLHVSSKLCRTVLEARRIHIGHWHLLLTLLLMLMQR